MHEVGKIVYLFDKKNHKIVPCRVIEKVSTVSLKGETVHHIVETPGKKTLKLEEYKGPRFSDIDEAKSFLLSAAEDLIDRTVQETLRVKSESFPEAEDDFMGGSMMYPPKESSVDNLTPEVESPQSDSVVVDLGDGQKAKVSLPNGF